MDDTCAVCAETLEWSAYGACGHKDVCSTCVARLRFICDDRRCCICKTESHTVFVTKAMGDYTKTISDFSLLPTELKEGKVGQYWYHEDTQGLFDDFDHYKMIKAMCKLSCSVCDRMEDQPGDSSRRIRFRSIEQLKGHLFHKHKLLMCNLCLEGRKVFICEQKLFTRSQLTRHMNSGDSEADGPESEKDGFTGHPMCEFCRTPFYGDNELYLHMSTEHFTCHICLRHHPGQYDYFKNYDELEIHFRHDHFLCEDEGCLGKKFIVFPSEAELKRHNTLEHGGRMSRSQRSAALQLPTSFRYRRSSEQENRRERGHVFEPDPSENELSLAIQASLQMDSSSSNNQSTDDIGETADVESQFPPLESSSAAIPEKSARYLQAVSHGSTSGELGDSSFPPLAGTSGNERPNSHLTVLPKKNMAAHLRSKNNGKVRVLVSSSRPTASQTPADVVTGGDAWPSVSAASGSSSSVQNTGVSGPYLTGYSLSSKAKTPSVPYSSISASSSSSKISGIRKGITHSSSAPSLSGPEYTETSSIDFPPVSAAHPRKANALHPNLVKQEDVPSANNSLVEKMHAALGFDNEKFTVFKEISGNYQKGSIDSETYVAYVYHFGLSHLVLELAALLPDAEKRKELVEAYNLRLRSDEHQDNLVDNALKNARVSKKGRGKAVDSSNSTANTTSSMTEQQSRYINSEAEVEVLSKEGYRPAKGKSTIPADDPATGCNAPFEPTNPSRQTETFCGSNQSSSNGEVKGKQKKKNKFLKSRLGDYSIEAVLDITKADLNENDVEDTRKEGSSVRGVWKNGGGKKLVASVSKGTKY